MRRIALVATGAAIAAAVLARRARPSTVRPDEGLIVGIPAVYDRLASWFLGPLHDAIADEVAALADPGAHVLDVGCGPGQLAERLVARGLRVTGVDLDPGMVARGRSRLGDRAALHAADVTALPFPDGTFPLVISTLSMHHWTDPAAGLAEVRRVLHPAGRVVIWDLADGALPFHTRFAGPGPHITRSGLTLLTDRPFRWPGPVAALRRVDAVHADGPSGA